MTKRRSDTEYQGPRIVARGMVRDRLMPADAANPCATPEARWIFDMVIDYRERNHLPDSKKERAATRAAKAVCGGCPVREACLVVHGPDTSLGVVGGATDAERKALFGGDDAA
jgi:hypothetical protein